MKTQIELYGEQREWELLKALSAMVAAAAVWMGGVRAVSNALHPASSRQPMFPPGTVITVPAAPGTPAPGPAR